MKKFFLLITVIVQFASISEAITETDFFLCQSNVPGYAQFRITQLVDETVENPQAKFLFKVDGTIETWRQIGAVKMSAETPIFEGKFRKNIPPADPLNPVPKPLFAEYLYISINVTGSGSLSIKDEMHPVKCLKLVELPLQ